MDSGERKTPTAFAISGEAFDRLLEAMGGIVVSVEDLGKKVDAATRAGVITAHVVRETRKDVAKVIAHVAELDKTVGELDGRTSANERNIRRHDAGLKTHSDADSKHESELAAFVIVIDETRKLAGKAAKAVEELKQSQTKTTEDQTAAIVQKVDVLDQDTKKARVPASVATAINLAIGIVYLILKIIESRH
jgi:uncharacterized tellurite resistance protein B-like protein